MFKTKAKQVEPSEVVRPANGVMITKNGQKRSGVPTQIAADYDLAFFQTSNVSNTFRTYRNHESVLGSFQNPQPLAQIYLPLFTKRQAKPDTTFDKIRR